MATKIQIPTSGNANRANVKKGHKCFWDANGNNSYSIALPANSFDEYPAGGTIYANNGGSSQQVTIMSSCGTGSTVQCTFQKVTTSTGGAAMASSTDDVTQSGQSDIVVDP